MKSLLASVRGGGGLDRVDQAVHMLEDEWRRHGEVQLERLWTDQKRVLAVDREDSVVVLAELIKADLRCRFSRGQSPTVAGYLDRFPELRNADSRVLSLIYEEFCLGEERGDGHDVESFCARYPDWRDSLASQLRYHRLFSQAAGGDLLNPEFPEPGDKFEEFDLVALLGRGGSSRVFLARDLSLGGKQVVLKVSLDRGQEPQAQGALDHPHIVPVNSVVFDDRRLRGLSMPFRPGLPLDEIIKRVNPTGRPRRAKALWDALVEGLAEQAQGSIDFAPETAGDAGPETPPPRPRGDGWDGFPVDGSYFQGVAWIGLVLARALAYAHGKRTFHRDVKPGNVLLTLHHGPQLLDFNLAESPHSARQAEAAMHGGTLPYMAPEQIEAFLDPERWNHVGAKADIYALGLVLRELVTGAPPDLPAEALPPPRALRALLDRRPMLDVAVCKANPDVPRALEAIVARCLCFSPDDRYPDARALVEDLRRFLELKPLVHVRNPSRRERFANWTTRRRWPLAVVAAALAPAILWSGYEGSRLAIRRLRPRPVPIETAPQFLAQVENAEAGWISPWNAELRNLEEVYDASPLPKVYRSFGVSHFANIKADRGAEADTLFASALALGDGRSQLIAWGKHHPNFVGLLSKFADQRFEVANREVDAAPGLDDSELEAIRRPLYSVAKQALEIAVELEPGSPDLNRLSTIAEEFSGAYSVAYKRLSQAIQSIPLGSDVDLETRKTNMTTMFDCCMQRARVASRIAESQRPERSIATAAADLDRLLQAEKDLQFCTAYLTSFSGNAEQERFVGAIRVQTLLARSETEVDLGRLADAQKHLHMASRAIQRYRGNARDADRQEVNRSITGWKKRYDLALAQLQLRAAVGAVAGGGPDAFLGLAPVERIVAVESGR
jgi:serine/threonine protein kinase